MKLTDSVNLLKYKVRLDPVNQRKSIQGFTLIELLVVMIVIGILGGLAYPSFLNQISKARGAEAKGTLGTINRAQQAYRYENNVFAPSSSELQATGLALNNRFFGYTILGTINTSEASATPVQTTLKVYAAGAALGLSDRFVQIICESDDIQGAPTGNTASVAVSSTGPSASCTTGRPIQ